MTKHDKPKEPLITDCDVLKDELNSLKANYSLMLQNFQYVVDKNVDGIIITDYSGIIKYVNKAAEKMFGGKKEKLVGGLFGLPVIEGEFSEIDIIGNNKANGVGEIRSADILWEGEKTKLLTIRDITTQNEVEKASAESKYRFSKLIKESPSIIEIYDETGLQILVNKAYERMWGFDASQTLKKFNILKSEEVIKTGLIQYVRRAYEGEAVAVPQYKFDPTGATEARGQGRTRWLSTRIYPLKDTTGRVINIVVTHEDFTKTKEAEERLYTKIDELQRFHNLTVDREITMISLKREVNELLKKNGQVEKYTIVGE